MAAPIGVERAEPVITCDDFLAFQESLRTLRLLDDRVVHALNTSIPTKSFSGEVSAASQCKHLYEELETGHSQRDRAIRNCITVVSNRVTSLREERTQDMDNTKLLRSLRKEQTNLRLMQSELSVEEVVKDRTLKLFHERCRAVYVPPSKVSS